MTTKTEPEKRRNPNYMRLPKDISDALREHAAANTRTINGEIVHRLRESLGLPPALEPVNTKRRKSGD